ncbi:MAG TPA: hypothetical protein VIK91_26920 [Nannocystis sp.]
MTRWYGSILCALAVTLAACGGETRTVEPKTSRTAKTEAPAPVVEEKPAAPETVEAPTAEPDPNAEKVKTAAAIAREIAADPEHADEVLRRHGLDREKLDAMMFEIAADPALTEAYMAARRTT